MRAQYPAGQLLKTEANDFIRLASTFLGETKDFIRLASTFLGEAKDLIRLASTSWDLSFEKYTTSNLSVTRVVRILCAINSRSNFSKFFGGCK